MLKYRLLLASAIFFLVKPCFGDTSLPPQIQGDFTLRYQSIERDVSSPAQRAAYMQYRHEINNMLVQQNKESALQSKASNHKIDEIYRNPLPSKHYTITISFHAGKLFYSSIGVNETSVVIYDGNNTYTWSKDSKRATVETYLALYQMEQLPFPGFNLPYLKFCALTHAKSIILQSPLPCTFLVPNAATPNRQVVTVPAEVIFSKFTTGIAVNKVTTYIGKNPSNQWRFSAFKKFLNVILPSNVSFTSFSTHYLFDVKGIPLDKDPIAPIKVTEYKLEYVSNKAIDTREFDINTRLQRLDTISELNGKDVVALYYEPKNGDINQQILNERHRVKLELASAQSGRIHGTAKSGTLLIILLITSASAWYLLKRQQAGRL